MEGWKMSIGTLREDVLNKLSKMLDNLTCGWRQLASVASEHPKFRCSESELTSCSLQVLSAAGSPGRALLDRLADRSCSLDFLLQCLMKMDHQEAVQYLNTIVSQMIQITEQPQSQQATVGSRVVLTCRASGPPGLSYQWFRGKDEILDATGSTPELVLCPLAPVHQGHYICRVNHGENCSFSQWAHVLYVHSAGCSSSLFPGSVSGLLITHQPQSQAVSEGDTLYLECNAEANPPAQYEWYHNLVPLKQHKTHSLKIPCVTTAHRGQYRCRVFNLYHEAWTDTVTVTIGPSSITDASWVEVDRGPDSQEVHISTYGPGKHPLKRTVSPSLSAKHFYATDKVALLIGNMNYLYHTQLCAPIADVHELTNLLRQMDFKVVSLLDLNWQEMHSAVTEFLLLLDKGVYGLLYFAGHGYENYGNSFMVPIDAPASYTSEHCLCVQNILTRMQQKETGLNVFLLDMCRKRNLNDDIIVQPGLIKVTANIVFGYATCVDAEAYEVKREDVSNGIFISFLKQRVCDDEKVTVMLDRVAEDMGRCEITRGRQALELRSNLSERRSLTDRIQTSDHCSASYSARNLQWAVAHVLPESLYLQFDCGVKVQLGFAAEFSNVMVIYTRILEKPKEIVSCSAQLTDFPEDVDIDLKKSNQETLLEAGSLLLIKETLPSPEVPCLYTCIQSLQRLRRELTFTACLHYTYTNMDEEVQERKPVTAIEEEGGNPDEIIVAPESAPKKSTPKRTAKDTRQENDEPEDTAIEEDSRDGHEELQDDHENMQEMDILDMNILDETDNDNGIPADEDEIEYYRSDEDDEERDDGAFEPEVETRGPEVDESEMLDKDEFMTFSSVNMSLDPEADDVREETENDKVAGSCLSEPLIEDHHQSHETSPEEEQAATMGGEEIVSDTGAKSYMATSGDVEDNKDLVETDTREVGDTQNVPEETFDAENKNSQAVSVSKQGAGGETVDSEMGSNKGEEDEKTEEKAATDSASTVKESSSVEGDDQKKSSEEKDGETETKDEKAAGGGAAASSSRNLWVSGLSSTTRATDLKTLFSKYGKVVGAKVVTNAKSPGARCYGFVTMSSTEEATKCISHLHRTELHGRMISVERAKNEPAGKKPADKNDTKKSGSDRRHSSDSKSDGKDEKSEGEGKDGKGRNERTVVMDKSKGEPVISVKTKSKERSTKSRDRKSSSKEKKDILSFDQIKEQRERERQRQREREIREVERRRFTDRDRDNRPDRERERIRLFREREERKHLMRKRHWLEAEKQRLDADRMERQFLERERLRIEYERRREQERILRERDELRRQQEQLRYEQERRSLKRPYDMDGRKDDWPDKRMTMDDRYGRSDFGRQERYQDFDHRDRGRYQDDMMMDRRDNTRGMGADRDGQHFSDRSDRHGRDGRDSWSGGYDKRINPREGGRDWDSSRKMDGDRAWQSRDGAIPGQSHMARGGMAGRGGYMNTGTSQSLSGALNRQNQLMQGSGLQGGAFGRRY